jgi:hypothetical protein
MDQETPYSETCKALIIKDLDFRETL